MFFSEEEDEFRSVLRRGVREKLANGATARARMDRYPDDVLKKLVDLGVTTFNMPPSFGGEEVSYVIEGIVCEELARVDFNAALWFLASRRQAKILETGASARWQEKYLPAIAAAESWTALGVTEPRSGNDYSGVQTKAVKDGDEWVLTGEKTSVTGGMFSPFVNIFARTIIDGEDRGISGFVVPFDTPGVQRHPFDDGVLIPVGRASVFLDDVRLPSDALLGEPGSGGRLALGSLQAARPIVALMALGVAAQTLQEAIAYAKDRVVFGRPIGGFQGVSFRLADAAAEIEAARLLCYDALRRLDATGRDEFRTSMAKLVGTDCAVKHIKLLMEVWGHFAFTHEFPLLQRYLDAMSTLAWDGTNDIHRVVIARHLLGREVVHQ